MCQALALGMARGPRLCVRRAGVAWGCRDVGDGGGHETPVGAVAQDKDSHAATKLFFPKSFHRRVLCRVQVVWGGKGGVVEVWRDTSPLQTYLHLSTLTCLATVRGEQEEGGAPLLRLDAGMKRNVLSAEH